MKHRTMKSGTTLNVYKTENDIPQDLRLKLNVLDDADTADIFTEISRGIDKWLWFVEAHTQAAH